MPSRANNTGKRKIAKNITEFLKWVNKLDGGIMFYRGVFSEDYNIEASICRRSRPADSNISLVEKSKELLQEARNRGHSPLSKTKETDLQLLARLQHHQAATCLIDFTSNPLVALWFACKTNPKEESKKDSKVFAFDAGDPDQCRIIDTEQSNKSIEELLSYGKNKLRETDDILLAWAPQHQESRIRAQQSVFVFGKPKIDVDKENIIFINNADKSNIHDELRRKYGISEYSLFNDFYGFASVNAEHRKYPILSGRGCYDTAEHHRANQNYDDAIHFYNQALERPPYKAAYYGLARSYSEKGDYLNAIKMYQESIKYQTILKRNKKQNQRIYYRLGIAQYHLGIAQYQNGDYADAINSLKALRNDAGANFMLGNWQARLKSYKKAITLFTRAIRINNEHARAFNNRGNAKAELGNLQEAIEDYNEAIRINPQFASAFNNRGIDKAELGNLQGAIEDYNEAIRINPQYAMAFNNRGNAKAESSNYQEAIEDYNEAIRINPQYAISFNNRGNAKAELSNYQEAIKDFDEAIRINPQYVGAFFNRGINKTKLGDFQSAIEDFNEAIRINPQYAGAFFNRGIAKAELGDFQGAIKDYNEAIRINPEYAKAFNNRGNAKAELGDLQEAIEDYNETIRINPQLTEAFFNRALCKLQLDDKRGAWADFREAKRLNPKLKIPKIPDEDNDNK